MVNGRISWWVHWSWILKQLNWVNSDWGWGAKGLHFDDPGNTTAFCTQLSYTGKIQCLNVTLELWTFNYVGWVLHNLHTQHSDTHTHTRTHTHTHTQTSSFFGLTQFNTHTYTESLLVSVPAFKYTKVWVCVCVCSLHNSSVINLPNKDQSEG